MIAVDGAVIRDDGVVSLYWPRVDAARRRAIATMDNLRRLKKKAYEGWGSFRNYFTGYLGEETVSVEMIARKIPHQRELRCDGFSGDTDIQTAQLRVEVKCAGDPARSEFVVGTKRRMDFDAVVHVVNWGILLEDGYFKCARWTTPSIVRTMTVEKRRGESCYVARHAELFEMDCFWVQFAPR